MEPTNAEQANAEQPTANDAPFPSRAARLWDSAAEFLENGLEEIRQEAALRKPGDVKHLYDLWRIYVLAVGAIKSIQSGQTDILKEAQREQELHAEGDDEGMSLEFEKRLSEEMAEIRRLAGDFAEDGES